MYIRYLKDAEGNYRLAQNASAKGDKATALKYYLKAAEGGIVPAMTACGNLYLDSEFEIERDIESALKWFKRAAESNDITAINNVGYIHEVQENYDEALIWYEKAANLGNVTAMMNLAGIYRKHFKKRKLAQQWIDKAESCTDLESVKELACYYSEADAIKNHKEKAIKFYKKAADMGDEEAFNELGDLYLSIDEYDAAEHFYFEGAKIGNVAAMINFGTMMTYSPGNFEHAKFWLTRAMQHGNIYAVKLLGDLYKEYKEFPKALRWYRKAYNYGENTQQEIREVKKLLKISKSDYKLKLQNFD